MQNVVSRLISLRQIHDQVEARLVDARTAPKPVSLSFSYMGHHHRHLFAQIVAIDNLREAYALTAKGKRATYGYLAFKESAEVNLATLQASLIEGTYAPLPPREFTIYEPKPRQIAALSFQDRVVQHALCRVVAPIYDRSLMGRAYACRTGRGTHLGVRSVQSELRDVLREQGDVYFLKTDFRQFFASVNRPRLWRELEHKIACRPTLALMERFTARTGTGLPLGNLTSQLYANLYGAIFDRWLVSQGVRRWHRYMDDCVVIGHDWRPLLELLKRVEQFVSDEIHLKLSRWMVAHYQRGVNFLGYRIWPTHKLLRKDSVRRARRKLAAFTRYGETEERERFLGSWMGHAQWADSRNLMRSLGLSADMPLAIAG